MTPQGSAAQIMIVKQCNSRLKAKIGAPCPGARQCASAALVHANEMKRVFMTSGDEKNQYAICQRISKYVDHHLRSLQCLYHFSLRSLMQSIFSSRKSDFPLSF